MKKILFILLVLVLCTTEKAHAARTLYVSPTGSDTNAGTQASPWKSFYKAASSAIAGDTVIFEDGTYDETRQGKVLNSGTASSPIIFKARNKHMAKLLYPVTINIKIAMYGKKYITIEGFDITQNTRGPESSDKVVEFGDHSDFGVLKNNKIHNATEDLIKAYDTDYLTIDGNELYDATREGIDFMRGNAAIVRNNTFRSISRQAFMMKGGSRNIQIYNNTVTQDSGTMYVALGLGGSSDNIYTYDDSGFEGYHQVAWNNVVIARSPGVIQEALKMEGCDTCAYFNNVVIGANKAIVVTAGPGLSKNWTWEVLSRNPTYKNNIIIDCKSNTKYIPDEILGTLTIDYNLFFNCPSPPSQAHGISSDPKFINKLSDWHLQTISPAINKGQQISPYPTYTDANTPVASPMNIAFDVTGATRSDSWDIGIYESGTVMPTSIPTSQTLNGDFNNDTRIDLLDFNIWRDEFIGTRTTKTADLNLDTKIDLLDFNIWLKSYQNT